MKILEKAMELLEKDYNSYKDKIEDNYYIEIESPLENEEHENHESYCFNCSVEKKNELLKKYTEESIFVLHDISPESQSFCFCETCNEPLDTSLLFSNDELSHWEEYMGPKLTAVEKYELYCLFESFQYVNDSEKVKYKKRLKKIAKKTIKILRTKQ